MFDDCLSEYETNRLKSIAENRKVLSDLGLLNPYKPFRVIKNIPKRKLSATVSRPAKKIRVAEEIISAANPGCRVTRRSARLCGQEAKTGVELQSEIDKELEEYDDAETPNQLKFKENVFGSIPGIPVGTIWQTRQEASWVGVHRPWVAGIHGGLEGCYSLALSGGYEDDIDLGDCFTYTGEGGRDLKGTKANPKNLRTAPQSKDQVLSRGNFALKQSVESQLPVRVIRGYKLRSPFAPDEGYRYDGLYTVEKWWQAIGLSGYKVFKFALRRCDNQASPPWTVKVDETNSAQTETKDGNISPVPNSQDSGYDSDSRPATAEEPISDNQSQSSA